MRSTIRTHADLLNSLATHAFDLHLFDRWEHLLRECEQLHGEQGGAVLLDLDEAERSASLRALGMSAYRLIKLLARDLRHRRVALVLLTTRDYAEVEDLMRAGVHALLHPPIDPERCAEQVRYAAERRRASASRQRPAPATYASPHEQTDVVQSISPPLRPGTYDPAVPGAPPPPALADPIDPIVQVVPVAS
jgi:DNA-binding NarL/FixJ family response regulator